MKKKIIAVLCAAAMMASSGMPAYAKAKKTYITPSSVTLKVNAGKTISLKNNKKAVKWSTSSKNVTLSKKSRKGVTVTGKKAGSATVIARAGKKTYKTKVKVTSKKKKTTKKKTAKKTVKKVKKGLSVTKKQMTVGQSFILKMNGTTVKEWDADHRLKLTNKTKTSVKVTAVKANKKGNTSTVYAYTKGGVMYTCDVSIAEKNHEWVPVYKTVHHPEVSHNVTKTVTEPFVLETNGYIVHNSTLNLCQNHPEKVNFGAFGEDKPFYGFVVNADGTTRYRTQEEFMASFPDCMAVDFGHVSDGKGGYRARTYNEFFEAKKTDPALAKMYDAWDPIGVGYTDAQSVRNGHCKLYSNGTMYDSNGKKRQGWSAEGIDTANGETTDIMTPLYERTFVHHLTRTVTKTEKVVDKAAYDEKVIDHYVCKNCGATKKA